ncbi:MAG: hypothetical protein HDT26_12340 [Subdoligranulum sp.]|nr:hypothetical protein [Subdoligranulum sp.]
MVLDILFFRVAGVSFDNDDGSSRQAYISKLREGDPIGFESFEYQGELAFHVMTEDDHCIGNLPKEHISFIKEHYEQGHYFESSVSEILGLDEDGKRIPNYNLGVEVAVNVYDEKPRFVAPAPGPVPGTAEWRKQKKRERKEYRAAQKQSQKKVLTRKQCYVRAALWFFLSCGCLFPVSIYYLFKAWKTPK